LTSGTPREIANWSTGDVLAYLNESGLSPEVLPLAPDGLAELVALVADGTISRNQAKDVLAEALREPQRPKQIVEERGLAQVSDESALAAVVDAVLAANADAVDEYRAGDDKVRKKKRGFLIGQVQRELQGSANMQIVNRLIDERLD
jgi:aspartyl-tRNA(Asn)/glutamyl-tRNA(Gln) amidotransferase subunit B